MIKQNRVATSHHISKYPLFPYFLNMLYVVIFLGHPKSLCYKHYLIFFHIWQSS
ncbi:hypothetical protein AB205_0205110 [Aquarana catesbeiana]|uniref:Uncharacterized protein n=1 Tax=Aquarana catesbeiana TaxID=8400 RepID=A0A2G9RGK8_AQUCT|nr:hypothetical protein AB205_0205110 [Aquarana catesbeiana]